MPLAAASCRAKPFVVSFAVRGLAAASRPVAIFVKGSVANVVFRIPLSRREKGVCFGVHLHVEVFGRAPNEEEPVACSILALAKKVVGLDAADSLAQRARARDESTNNERRVAGQIVHRVGLVELVAFGLIGGKALENADRVGAIGDGVVQIHLFQIFIGKSDGAGADKKRKTCGAPF